MVEGWAPRATEAGARRRAQARRPPARTDAAGRPVWSRLADGNERRARYYAGGALAAIELTTPDGALVSAPIVDELTRDAHGRIASARLGDACDRRVTRARMWAQALPKPLSDNIAKFQAAAEARFGMRGRIVASDTASAGAADLRAIRARYALPERDTVAAARTNIPGIDRSERVGPVGPVIRGLANPMFARVFSGSSANDVPRLQYELERGRRTVADATVEASNHDSGRSTC